METLTASLLRRPLAVLLLALAVAGCGSAPSVEPKAPAPSAVAAPAETLPEPETETEEPVDRVEPPMPRMDPEPPRPVEPPLPEEKPAEPGDVLIRVGLSTDLGRLSVPCCDGTLTVEIDGAPRMLAAPFVIEPAAGASGRSEYRVQVAALRDDGQAQNLAATLAQRTGWPSEAQFDAGTGLYRVRVGRFPDRSAAEGARRRLIGFGLDATWIVQEGSEVQDPALRVLQGTGSFLVRGRWLAVRPREGVDSLAATVDGAGGRWRGSLLVYLNDRGALNLVNELPVESYLRGVVPRELGPAQYPRLEALKAQAVAARTYALRHLGEFAAEGYDLCASPRCQVYGGLSAEHPLSDRAVEETAGQVLLDGDRLADALYSATCGGHTENAEVVFPFIKAPYLRGVPCVEGGTTRLAGSLPAGLPFPDALADAQVARPASFGGGPGLTLPAATTTELSPERGKFLRYEDGRLTYDAIREAATRTAALPKNLATFGRQGGHLVSGELRLAPGDPILVYRRQGEVVALVQEVDAAAQPTDPAAKLKAWVRFRSDQELRHRVAERYPGFALRSFEVLDRGVSGRVGRLLLLGTDGRRERLEGLAVRWTLDLPDTLFEARRVTRGRKGTGWEFRGGGWGHGVGMCQVGAYQMAGRGLGYRDILFHYYSGLRLGRAVLK